MLTYAPTFPELRATEFARLDEQRTVYLDYTGAALYPRSLPRRDARRIARGIFGNPHSESPASRRSTDALERAREDVLRFFNADPSVYDVVFTANASGALRLVGDAFPFRRGSVFSLSADNHNSVHGIRECARRRGAHVQYAPLLSDLRPAEPGLPQASAPSIFAFPAQSNFSGVRHPLRLVSEAQRRGYRVLLDAAACAPTSPLSLHRVAPDFVAVSFYKMFGYPTGVGALIAKHDALAGMRRHYFGGGAVQFVSVQNRMHRLRTGAAGFEDGTPSFLALNAVSDGLRWLNRIGMRRISAHVEKQTAALLQRLQSFGDDILLYGPPDTHERGGTVAFNLVRNGRIVPYERVEAAAAERGVCIRGGCFCNPGSAEAAFAIPAHTARRCLRDEFTVSRFRECLDGPAVGAVRASVGIPTNAADLDALVDVLRSM
jgi:selenocysteine lyase/cysteine desulfurase